MLAQRTCLQLADVDQLVDVWPGSPVAPVQLSPGPLDMVLDGVVDAGFGVLNMSLGPRIADRAIIDEDRTGFVLAERPITACGVEVKPPALLVELPGREYRSLLEPGFRSIEIFCASSVLQSQRLGALLELLRDERGQPVIPLRQGDAARLRHATQAFIGIPERRKLQRDDIQLREVARHRVIIALTTIVARYVGVGGALTAATFTTRATARGTLAMAALTVIDRVGVCDVTLPDLLAELSVSRRALEKSFDRLLGVSPGQYLLACRLNRLRSNLLRGSACVTDCVIDSGFSDPSRTARQYRRLFGELPSSTLKRSLARTLSEPGAARPIPGRDCWKQERTRSHFA